MGEAPIVGLAKSLGLGEEELELYGPHKAKVSLSVLQRLPEPRARYVLVTGTTPTPLGEGKTTVTIGLGQALARLGLRSVVTLRQSSLGPVFGTKGAGAGGGAATLVPFPDVALHLTGDAHAVTAAHNLCAAFIDNALYHRTADLDPRTVTWPRVLDVNDRALRQVVVGLGEGGRTARESRFDITAASEVMAILSLATGYRDLRERLGRVVVGYRFNGRPVTAGELRVAGSMAALLVDALKPNLVRTCEGTAAFVHTGPFGNLAHGNSSVIADLIACRLGDVVVTEAGFGTELGAEKFFHIKCRASGLHPHAAVVVTTVRALKHHGGQAVTVTQARANTTGGGGRSEDLEALEAGLPNLSKHIENVKCFGVPAVVAVNRFPTDTDRELERVCQAALEFGADAARVVTAYERGGEGAIELARDVLRAASAPSEPRFLYPLEWPLHRKIEAVARQLYGAGELRVTARAREEMERLERLGYDRLPICMAKTPLSLSPDPTRLGRPQGFTVEVRELRLFAGAGFVTALLGDIQTMPGLARRPLGEVIDIDETGAILNMK